MNISEHGLRIYLVALQTFPYGMEIKNFAADVDPVTFDTVTPVKSEQLLDGSLLFYNTAASVNIKLTVVSGSEDDQNLKLLMLNKMAPMRSGSVFTTLTGVEDTIVMVLNYEHNGQVILSNGDIVSGMLGDSVGKDGSRKSNAYSFVFNNASVMQSLQTDIATVLTNIGSLL